MAVLSVTTSARAASALEQLAASMAPGTWAQLTVSNQNAVLGVGNQSGSMIHFCNAMPWNPVSKKIEIIGMDHNWGRERYAQYDLASNAFVLVSADLGFGTNTRHCYDHTAVNPYTGVVFHRMTNIATGVLSVRTANSGSANFVAVPDIGTAYDQIAIGSTWWSGPFGGAANQGAFVIFNSGDSSGGANDGQIAAWDPVNNAWIFNRRGMSPNYLTAGSTYHSVIEYSPQKNVAVYGGGNDAPTKLWRLNADGSFVTMPDVPAGKGVGIQKGNLVNDPVTGNFLLLSQGELWELNPDGAGSWTRKATPPSGVGNPGSPNLDGVISSAISDYGVVAYIKQTGTTGGTFYLYKNAASGPADTTPPTVNLTAPAAGTVSGTVTITAGAADNTGVAGVQFKLNGANLAAEDTAAPYATTWDSTTVSNGTYTLTAAARDAAGNQSTSAPVIVTVNNPVDSTPDGFNFMAQTGVALSSVATSSNITPAGYNTATSISVSGGSYSINGGAFVSTAGTLNPGQTVAVRLSTSASHNTQTCATLTIGGVSGPFCATTQAPQNTLLPPPAAAYAFSENGGTTASDTSGNGNTLTLNGATWSAGKSASGLSFNGVSGYATAPNSASLNIAGPLTIAFWTNIVDGSGTDYVFLGKAGAGGAAYQYGVEYDANNTKTVNFYFRSAAGSLQGPYSMSAPLGVWTHIAYTYDGSVVNGYVDGVLKLTANNTAGIGASTGNLVLGADPNFGQVLKGGLDEVRIYNRALAQSEIQSDMGAPAVVDTVAPTVNLSAPVAGAVSGTVTVSANATDNLAVAGVQFKLNGANLAAEDTSAPYTISWNTATIGNGAHTLTAVARDAAGNQTTSAPLVVTVNNPVDTAPDAFGFALQTGVALNTVVTSGAITPAGYNAAAAISVSGGSYSINGGAFVTTTGTLSPGQTVAVRLTSAVSNNTQTCANLTIGGVAGQFCATTQGIVTGGQDYATRCAQPGVVKCVGFDSAADFTPGTSTTTSGIFPPSGTTDYTRAVQDTSIKASGAGSLRFTIPSNSPADTSGSYYTNFSSDLSTQFGAGEEFYVQWRQRFSPEFLNTAYTNALGWKQVIVGTGDQPGGRLYFSCSDLELVVVNAYNRGFPEMYNSCTGSASHGPYDGFEERYGASDFKLQNARPAPFCLYSQSATGYFPPNGNCFPYVANEWMTFQMRVQLGPRVGNEFVGSFITLWGAREGRASEMLIQWGPYNVSAGPAGENQRYGKIWFTPYNTDKSSAQVHPTAYTWFDELIISRNKIEDPPLTQPPAPDSAPDAFSFTAQTGIAPNAVVTSNTVTPAGYNTAAPISVTGGSYSINGGAFVTTAGSINPGQNVALRMTASSAPGTATGATLAIGGTAATFTVTTQAVSSDITPDAFSFTAQTGIAPGTVVTSNSITPAGYNAAAAISVSGGSYSINGGAFVTTAGTINPGQSVAVRLAAPTANSSTATTTLTIGGVTGSFAVTTQAVSSDITPDAFSFTAQTGIAPGAVVTSNSITPAGYNAAAAISVTGGSYSINGGAFVSAAGTINPGQSVAVRLAAPTANSSIATATLTIGGVTGTFAVTTQAAGIDSSPDPFGFNARTGMALNTTVTSNTITPSGYAASTSISVSVGSSYSINGGAFVSTPGTISPGQNVAVRLTTAGTYLTTTTATLTIGGVAGTFGAITRDALRRQRNRR